MRTGKSGSTVKGEAIISQEAGRFDIVEAGGLLPQRPERSTLAGPSTLDTHAGRGAPRRPPWEAR
jgi:hypothetical protein